MLAQLVAEVVGSRGRGHGRAPFGAPSSAMEASAGLVALGAAARRPGGAAPVEYVTWSAARATRAAGASPLSFQRELNLVFEWVRAGRNRGKSFYSS